MTETRSRATRKRPSILKRIRAWLLPDSEQKGPQEQIPQAGAAEADAEASPEVAPVRQSVSSPTGRRFEEFELPEPILRGIRDAGFERCTPIQDQCLPLGLQGRDVAGQAQTGTGKTAVFLITLLDRLLRMEGRDPAFPSALVVAPTRELALQIFDDARVLGAHTGLRMGVAFGGVDWEKQARQLREGLDIVIGTPGRIIDYMKQGVLVTRRVRVLVIDEADRMFDMGFIRDLRYILRRLPPYDRRQSMLFSATLSYRVLELAYEHMNQPQEVYIEPQERTVDTVEQCVYHVGMDEKLGLLLGLLKREPWERILIFCNTKAGVEFVAAKLVGNGYPAEGITGDLPQRKRLQLMEQFKSGTLKILVATDVASRGIHVEDISHVINYDVPQDREDYVHRIGRTARAGKKGNAITLADERWAWHLEAIEGFMGKKIPMAWFDADWLEADLAPRVSRRRTFRERPEGGRRERRPSSRGQGPRPRGRQAAPRPRPEAPPQPKEPTAAQKPRRRRSRGRREKPGEAAQGASPAAPPPGTHE